MPLVANLFNYYLNLTSEQAVWLSLFSHLQHIGWVTIQACLCRKGVPSLLILGGMTLLVAQQYSNHGTVCRSIWVLRCPWASPWKPQAWCFSLHAVPRLPAPHGHIRQAGCLLPQSLAGAQSISTYKHPVKNICFRDVIIHVLHMGDRVFCCFVLWLLCSVICKVSLIVRKALYASGYHGLKKVGETNKNPTSVRVAFPHHCG